MNARMWNKQAEGKARWAIEWGGKHNVGVKEAGEEVLRLIAQGEAQSEILRASAYLVCTRVYLREAVNA